MPPLASAQIRAARSLIRWTAEDLASASALSVATIRRAERRSDAETALTAANDLAIRHAFEMAGVEFIDENGRGPGSTLAKAATERSGTDLHADPQVRPPCHAAPLPQLPLAHATTRTGAAAHDALSRRNGLGSKLGPCCSQAMCSIIALATLKAFLNRRSTAYAKACDPVDGMVPAGQSGRRGPRRSTSNATIRSASILQDGRAVFNIAGNKYRIVVWINYPYRVVYIRFIGTHRQYDAIDAQTI